MDNTQERDELVGEFIVIPAWKASGLVLETKPSMFGTEFSVDVLLQAHPDDEKPRWYRLEPWSYRVE